MSTSDYGLVTRQPQSIQVTGGEWIEVTDDEHILYRAFLVVRKSNKSTVNRLIQAIAFRRDIKFAVASEWVERVIIGLIERGALIRERRENETDIVKAAKHVSSRQRKRNAVMNRYGDRCAYCGRTGQLTLDHVQPQSRGGANTVENLRPCCPDCNAAKADRTPEEWAADILAVRETEPETEPIIIQPPKRRLLGTVAAGVLAIVTR